MKTQSCLVIMAGLPATGKSTLARALAPQVAGTVLDKDLIRAALFPEPWIDYSQEQDDLCVEVLLQSAEFLVGKRALPFIFVDGRPFALRSQIERMLSAAREMGCRSKIIHTMCSDATARERLLAWHAARNRTYDLYLDLKSKFEGIREPHLVVNTDQPLEAAVKSCITYLFEWLESTAQNNGYS